MGGGCSRSAPSSHDEPLDAGESGAAVPQRVRRGPKKHEFTKTQELLLREIAAETAVSGGLSCTKRELAERLGRNVKTIDRLLSDLRRRGVVEVEARFDERGAQQASVYRVVVGRPSAPR